MADVTVKVLTAATSFDLITLDEAKLLLGIVSSDTSQDELLQMQITINSATIAEICNRVFAKETVKETWREIANGRLFLTHWPVKETDVTSVISAGYGWVTNQYELEEASGKLSNVVMYAAEANNWAQSVIVTYTGGFVLPDEAPWPLKQATVALIRDDRILAHQAAVAGVRQLSHKDSRVMFFDVNAAIAKQSTAGKSAGRQMAENLCRQYTRIWA